MLYSNIIKKHKHMNDLKVYLIFPDRNDIFNYITFKCFSSELNQFLINEELMGEGDDCKDFEWVIFEDGIMIQG
jgi:hypothetical protein